MACCGQNHSVTTQALVPLRDPVPDAGQIVVIWAIKPAGMTKYIMETGRAYMVFKKGAKVAVYEDDLPELIHRGLILDV